jgi:hypothetical protein
MRSTTPIVVCRKAHTRHPRDYWLFPALLDYHELYPVSLVITGHDHNRGRVCLVLAVTARRLDIARHRGLKARSAVIVGLQWVRTKRDDSSSTQGSVVCYCTLLYTVPYTCVSIGVQ